jgi:hypothetical protein
MIKPIDVLKETVKKHESALRHSMYAFNKGEIDARLHKSHRRRNHLIINRFNKAIEILEEHGKKRQL